MLKIAITIDCDGRQWLVAVEDGISSIPWNVWQDCHIREWPVADVATLPVY